MLGQMVARQTSGAVTPTDGSLDPHALADIREDEDEEEDGEALVAELRSEGTATSQAVADVATKAKKAKTPHGREGLLLNALVADPRNVDALTRLGLLYEQRGAHSKSIELLFRATKVDPKRTQYLFVHIAHAHLCQHQWQQALETIEHATSHPENRIAPMLHYTIGRLYDRVDQREVSEPALRQCLKLSPWYPESREVFFRLGCMYREMRKYERAFYCLNKAVTDGNGEGFFDLSVIWLELGTVARLLNKRAEAEAAFANSGLDPDVGASWHYAGNDYLGKLEYLKAFRCFRKAVALDPENHDLWASLIDLYRTMGQNEEALEAYYGFATIDAAAKLRREHAATYAKQIGSLEAALAQKEAQLKEKEAARRNVEQLAGQQQKILQNLNSDLENQRQSRSARESFLELQLKEALRKDGMLKQREQEMDEKAAEWQRKEKAWERERQEWAERERQFMALSMQPSHRNGEDSDTDSDSDESDVDFGNGRFAERSSGRDSRYGPGEEHDSGSSVGDPPSPMLPGRTLGQPSSASATGGGGGVGGGMMAARLAAKQRQRTLRRAAASEEAARSDGGGGGGGGFGGGSSRPPGFGGSGTAAPSMNRTTHAAKLRAAARVGRAF